MSAPESAFLPPSGLRAPRSMTTPAPPAPSNRPRRANRAPGTTASPPKAAGRLGRAGAPGVALRRVCDTSGDITIARRHAALGGAKTLGERTRAHRQRLWVSESLPIVPRALRPGLLRTRFVPSCSVLHKACARARIPGNTHWAQCGKPLHAAYYTRHLSGAKADCTSASPGVCAGPHPSPNALVR